MIRFFPLLAPYNNCGPYGMRGATMHDAVDLCAPTGTVIIAVDDGTVTWGTDPVGGNVAVLHCTDGTAVYYAHMLDEQSGSKLVQAGDEIGRVDMSGNAQGTVPHCHFQVWSSGSFNGPHPDPTAELLAAPQLYSPIPPPPAPTNPNARALLVGLGIVALSAGLAWAIRGPLHLRRHAA